MKIENVEFKREYHKKRKKRKHVFESENEFIYRVTDCEGKLIFGIYKDGTMYANCCLEEGWKTI